MDLIGRLWTDSPLYLTREQFEKSLEGWTIEPVEADGLTIGVFLVRGPEIHFFKMDKTSVGRGHLQRLGLIIQQHGYAITRTPRDDARMLRFNKRLGFYPIGEDQYDIHLRIDRLKA